MVYYLFKGTGLGHFRKSYNILRSRYRHELAREQKRSISAVGCYILIVNQELFGLLLKRI